MFSLDAALIPVSFSSSPSLGSQGDEEIDQVVEDLKNDPRVQRLGFGQKKDEFIERLHHNAASIKTQLLRLLDSGTSPREMQIEVTRYKDALYDTANSFFSEYSEDSRRRKEEDQKTDALAERLFNTPQHLASRWPTLAAGTVTGTILGAGAGPVVHKMWQNALDSQVPKARTARSMAMLNFVDAKIEYAVAAKIQHQKSIALCGGYKGQVQLQKKRLLLKTHIPISSVTEQLVDLTRALECAQVTEMVSECTAKKARSEAVMWARIFGNGKEGEARRAIDLLKYPKAVALSSNVVEKELAVTAAKEVLDISFTKAFQASIRAAAAREGRLASAAFIGGLIAGPVGLVITAVVVLLTDPDEAQ